MSRSRQPPAAVRVRRREPDLAASNQANQAAAAGDRTREGRTTPVSGPAGRWPARPACANSGRSEAGATEKWVPAFAMDVICWAGSGPDGKTEDARRDFAQSM